MLIDLLYHSLPTAQKRRWHFNAFMLHIFSSLEEMRRSSSKPSVFATEDEYSLLRLARDTVRESPIIFLDEFQLPDRASAKLMSGLLVSFWSMGGVLVGSSNRQPGGLVKAAGTGREGEFEGFLEALGRRCEFWNMGGDRDWRRVEKSRWWKVDFGGAEKSKGPVDEPVDFGQSNGKIPKFCFLPNQNRENIQVMDERWKEAIRTTVANELQSTGYPPQPPGSPTQEELQWESQDFHVYGRKLHVSKCKNGVATFNFNDLCGKNLGPADYITLTSHFHTLFIDSMPTLTHSSLKNEARRFITLLDAIYESGVRLAIRIEGDKTTTIDDLFFPDAIVPAKKTSSGERKVDWDISGDSDAIQSEVFAESYQDLTSPFRPNISFYDSSPSSAEPTATPKVQVDFSQLAAFTGEDEKFAFRRAVSRLWEVCSEGWWTGVEWRPSVKSRLWENSSVHSNSLDHNATLRAVDSKAMDAAKIPEKVSGQERDGVLFSPFRRHPEPPPKFAMEHFWAVVRWGRRAGNWGKGVEGVKERKKGDREN